MRSGRTLGEQFGTGGEHLLSPAARCLRTSTACLASVQVSLSHLALVCGKRTQNLLLLPLGHVEKVKRSPKLGRDFIELRGRNPECAVGYFQANRGYCLVS